MSEFPHLKPPCVNQGQLQTQYNKSLLVESLRGRFHESYLSAPGNWAPSLRFIIGLLEDSTVKFEKAWAGHRFDFVPITVLRQGVTEGS